ncbi:MAG: SDR family NAD(P)-dependent oxidoreductase [Prolixibacteraceae bacterium]|nr:SDR family NAD(P)-dependent oxidoreductase [Prolixibacteraceae bacterium]
MNKISLITGATSGIGKATALLLAKNGYNLIITGRRKELLSSLEDEIKIVSNSQVYKLCFDVRDRNQVENEIDNLPQKWKNIDLLVNNAGLSLGLDPLNEGSIDDWETMIDTNIKGLLYMSRKVANLMIPRNCGHIINISSVAGKEVYPNGNVYCATKNAVEALTKGMRIDLLKHNIKVGSVSPGMVETEFSIVRFHGDIEKASSVYYGLTPLYAEDIAEAIFFMVTRPPHVNIDDIFIMPTAQGSARDTIRNNDKK